MRKYCLSVKEVWHRMYFVEADSPDEAEAKLRASLEAGTDLTDYATKEPEYLGQLDDPSEDYIFCDGIEY